MIPFNAAASYARMLEDLEAEHSAATEQMQQSQGHTLTTDHAKRIEGEMRNERV